MDLLRIVSFILLFVDQNQSLAILLGALALVGFALYVVLEVVRKLPSMKR